ncbi:MAG: cupin domain-containing protein [Bacteroidetes bacterium]|nr:cupin domain-containing protein [Bacteroidota bacterium]MCB9227402.1 cupin domain-containing protein [Chitinophagales bacterium]
MKTASLFADLDFKENKPAVSVLLQTDFTKEIRIAFKENQELKEHKTPYPIVVEIVEGEISFGVQNESLILKKGDLISLKGNIPHSLTAQKESIVRLTLSILDSEERVKNINK